MAGEEAAAVTVGGYPADTQLGPIPVPAHEVEVHTAGVITTEGSRWQWLLVCNFYFPCQMGLQQLGLSMVAGVTRLLAGVTLTVGALVCILSSPELPFPSVGKGYLEKAHQPH